MKAASPTEINCWLQAAAPGATVYLIGAGGCGMSGLGHLLLDLGFSVAGSDLQSNEEIRQLQQRGARLHSHHAAEQVIQAQPVLVVYSSAIPEENPERVAGRNAGIPVVHRASVLAALMGRQCGVGIVGMHGKTTTSALLAFALEYLGARPSYAIGALAPQLRPHARFVQAPSAGPATSVSAATPPASPHSGARWFVAEIDESDGSLSQFQPDHAVLLNVDEEHLDYYADLEDVSRQFRDFVQRIPGRVIYCADDPALKPVVQAHPQAISYGFHPQADYRIQWPPEAETSTASANSDRIHRPFEVWHRQQRLGVFSLQIPGDHNISNAAAVIAFLHQMGNEPAPLGEAIRLFKGAARRQQTLYHDARYRIVEDYGHHPREIEATLEALGNLGARRRLVAFQPHRYTRTQKLLPRFASCFAGADHVWITEIYAASEPAISGVSAAGLAEAIQARGQSVEWVPVLGDLGRRVRTAMQPGDLVIFLGAGDIGREAQALAQTLRQEQKDRVDRLYQSLTEVVSPTTVVRREEPMSRHTTWRVGGAADLYIEPESEGDLTRVLQWTQTQALPFRVVGRGSNLLVKDGGLRGLVIGLTHPSFQRIQVEGTRVHCGAGARLKQVVAEARRHCLSGLEFLEGIPGSVGGALRMNAGAMGASFCEVVEAVRIMDFHGQVRALEAKDLAVRYRSCPFFQDHIALSAVLRGQSAPLDVIERRLKEFSERRWKSQPAAPSAGCVFKNPDTTPAGKLIDELGLKGTRVGGAVVSSVHGNFIVNEGRASAEDILQLIEIIRQRARDRRGIHLEPEVEIVGESPC